MGASAFAGAQPDRAGGPSDPCPQAVMAVPALIPLRGSQPTPEQIVANALAHNPVAKFALFSGGDGSLRTTHWLMNNVPGCEVLHINTGIGFRTAREFVRDTCSAQGWKLTEVRAKEDCGQDYETIVLKHGFPGPAGHQFMYRRLKERCVEFVVRNRKTKRSDKVMLATGICHDDSARRSGYGGREINFKGAQMWVNPMYWQSNGSGDAYIRQHGLKRNPVSEIFGMSGECLCGAFAKPGELRSVRFVCPKTADYIEALQERVRAAGHDWGWEDRPPRPPRRRDDALTIDLFSDFQPLCTSCVKSEAHRDRDAAPRKAEGFEAEGQQPGRERSERIAHPPILSETSHPSDLDEERGHNHA